MKFAVLTLLLATSNALASTSNGIVTITAPANGSTVATPVTVTASAVTPPTCSAGIAAMGIYPTPSNLLYKTSATSFSKSFVLNPGSYPNFIVQEWDKCGGSSKVSISITVTGSLPPPPSVTTWGYATQRNNVNTQEYILTPTNVRTSTFKRLFSYPVDGYIYGQPLFVPKNVTGSGHNIVYVATENNSVYAFDADGGGQLWKKSFGSAIPCGNVHGCGVAPTVGITATPVIDTTLRNIYVANRQFNSGTGTYSHSLHSLNLLTGAENAGSPVTISGSVTGTGYDAVNGKVTFNPKTASQRSSLLEMNGVVYGAFGSYGDADPYHGWIIGFSASSLARMTVFNSSPNGQRAGIWGGPLASDGTYIYTATGNGTSDSGPDWGNSYMKLSPVSGTLSEADFFTPFNVSLLSTDDRDLGSAMATLLPTFSSSPFPRIMIGAGKEGRIYVVSRDNMGHFDSSCDCQIVQSITNAVGVATNSSDLQRNFSTPPYWNGNVYFSGTNDYIKRFHLSTSTSKLATTPSDHSPTTYAFPGSNPVVSGNGNGSGILWAVDKGASVLHAYDATKVSTELYNTNQNATRDALGSSVKFAPPLIVNGKVYVGTADHLVVYGNF
jgi:PQQ-like domain